MNLSHKMCLSNSGSKSSYQVKRKCCRLMTTAKLRCCFNDPRTMYSMKTQPRWKNKQGKIYVNVQFKFIRVLGGLALLEMLKTWMLKSFVCRGYKIRPSSQKYHRRSLTGLPNARAGTRTNTDARAVYLFIENRLTICQSTAAPAVACRV